MTEPDEVPEHIRSIPGAADLITRFGRWPSFHDAEVTDLTLRRDGTSTITFHIFRMTSEISSSGHYVTDLHTLVTFTLGEIIAMELYDFNHQNVVFGLGIEKQDDGIELTLDPCYGLSGSIRTNQLSLSFVEGIPTGSVYAKSL
jgi:hypothetical protein